MILNPIVPLVWVLIWILRAIKSSVDGPKPAGQVRKRQATQLTGSDAVVILLYMLSSFALAIYGMVVLSARFSNLWPSFLVFGLAFYLPFAAPHWLAWRVLAPLGWPRMAKACLWLACHVETGGRRGTMQLIDAACRPGWQPGRGGMTAWTMLALALKAEAEEDPERADRLLEGIGRTGRPPSLALRSRGVELVAWAAARREDWPRVRKRVEVGRGRGVRLLRLLADAHLDGRPPRAIVLWPAWALAPQRLRTLPFVRAARAVRPGRTVAPVEAEPLEQPRSVWLRHLRLLARGAAGRTLRTAEVEELAGLWETTLTGEGQARILSRGLELGVQGVAQAAEALRGGLLAELQALATVAEGPWRATAGVGLAGLLRAHQIESILALLEVEKEGFPTTGGVARELDPPGVELDRWHRFRRNVDRLVVAGGADALLTAWFNGLRFVVCNWPVFLERAYGREAALACAEMHRWSATVARRLRDEEIHSISSKNAANYGGARL